MSVPRASRFVVDPDDPRAPSEEAWALLTPEERQRVVADLPSEFPVSESAPPEGNDHWDSKVDIVQTLSHHFERLKRRVTLACELPVYYPGEPMFAPDVIAVVDVDLRRRQGWVVSAEGKGLDLALEVHVSGRRLKDVRRNTEWYARLGIPEYFVFDRRRSRLQGFRLPGPGARAFEPIVPQRGRYESRVLGLDLMIVGERLRFVLGEALLPDTEELIERLDAMVEDLEVKRARAAEVAEQEARLREQAELRLRDAEAKLAELAAELERARGGTTH